MSRTYVHTDGRFFFVFCPMSLFCPFNSPLHVGYISSLYGQQILFLFQRKRFREISVLGHPIHDRRSVNGDWFSLPATVPSTGPRTRRRPEHRLCRPTTTCVVVFGCSSVRRGFSSFRRGCSSVRRLTTGDRYVRSERLTRVTAVFWRVRINIDYGLDVKTFRSTRRLR